MSGLQRAGVATAAVFVDGRRRGSAVLIDAARLLTARHVLGSDPSQVNDIELIFPGYSVTGSNRLRARRVLPDEATAGGVEPDVALLELLGITEGLPEPVPLWAGRRPPEQVEVFGYPVGEKELSGVWRKFTVSGPTSQGTVQLDWAGAFGTRPGHSGGPVLDADTGAMAGILIEGAVDLGFDRYVPVYIAQQQWRTIPRPWLYVGARNARIAACEHFEARARGGQRVSHRGTDLFRGRAASLDAVTAWLRDADPPGAVQVLTGQPGAGKSAVLARSVLYRLSDVGPGLAFHAHDATHDDLLAALVSLTGADAPTEHSITAALDNSRTEVWLVAVDALDQARTYQDARALAGTLSTLAKHPQVRVVVATRPRVARHSGNGSVDGLIGELGVQDTEDPALVDLDSDRYAADDGLSQFAGALLRQHGFGRGNPAGGAWQQYRTNPVLCERLVAIIAERARRNFLVTFMAADQLSRRRSVLDPADPGFRPEQVPARVGDALAGYFESLDESERNRRRGLLTALAYARGAGISESLWLRFANAIGYPSTQADLDGLRTSAAADYLLQSTHSDTGTALVGLFHQALTDELIDSSRHSNHERSLVSLLMPNRDVWRDRFEVSYINTHLVDHAAVADKLVELLSNAHYVNRADLSRLIPYLRQPVLSGDETALVIRRAAPRASRWTDPMIRSRLFELAAAHRRTDNTPNQFSQEGGGKFCLLWASPNAGTIHDELVGHTDAVKTVAIGRSSIGRSLLATASNDGTARIWDLETSQNLHILASHGRRQGAIIAAKFGYSRTGQLLLATAAYDDDSARIWNAETGKSVHTLSDYDDWVLGVAFGQGGDGGHLLATLCANGYGRIRDPDSGQTLHTLGAPNHWISTLAFGYGSNGQPLLATGSTDGTTQIWDPDTGQILHTLTPHTSSISMLEFGYSSKGQPLLATGSIDGTAQIWDSSTGQALHTLTAHTNSISTLAFGNDNAGVTLFVTADYDGVAHVWSADTGELLHTLTGHTNSISRIVFGYRSDRRPLLATGSADGTARIWDLDGSLKGEGYSSQITSLATRQRSTNSAAILATGDRHGSVQIWDPDTGHNLYRFAGHTRSIIAIEFGYGRNAKSLLATASIDNTARIWDPDTGQALNTFAGHDNSIGAIALGHGSNGQPLLATASIDNTVKIWDSESGDLLQTLTSRRRHFRSSTKIMVAFDSGRDGRSLLATTGLDDNAAQILDPDTGQVLHTLTGHDTSTSAIAFGHGGSGEALFATADMDGLTQVWNADTGQCLHVLYPRTAPKGYPIAVSSLSFGYDRNGRPLLATGGIDGTTRVWDPSTGRALHALSGHAGSITTITFGNDGNGLYWVITTGHGDDGARIWDLLTGFCIAVLPQFTGVSATSFLPGILVVAGHGLAAYKCRL